MVTVAKTAPNLHISNQTFLVSQYKVQQHTIPHWLLHHLYQKVIVNAFQEPPGLFVPCCVVPPADVRCYHRSTTNFLKLTVKHGASCYFFAQKPPHSPPHLPCKPNTGTKKGYCDLTAVGSLTPHSCSLTLILSGLSCLSSHCSYIIRSFLPVLPDLPLLISLLLLSACPSSCFPLQLSSLASKLLTLCLSSHHLPPLFLFFLPSLISSCLSWLVSYFVSCHISHVPPLILPIPLTSQFSCPSLSLIYLVSLLSQVAVTFLNA